MSVFQQVNTAFSQLTDYICSGVKGGASMRIHLCKRLPNYQSWFSTSLNFLIGLPFWLPLITRFHISLMLWRDMSTCTGSYIHADREGHAGSLWHPRTAEHLIFCLSWLRFCLGKLGSDTTLWSLSGALMPLFDAGDGESFLTDVVILSCSIHTLQRNRRSSWRKTRASPSCKWTTGESSRRLHAVDFRS